MLSAEKLTAPAPESGQTDLSPASGAPVDHAPHRGLLRSRALHRRRRLTDCFGGTVEAKRAGSSDFLAGKLENGGRRRRCRCGAGGGSCGGGGVEALLAHVVGGGIACDATVVDAVR